MSFTLGLVLVERMMIQPTGAVVPLHQLRVVRDILKTLPPEATPRVASAEAHFEHWSFDRVFDVGLRSLLLGIEVQGHRPVKAPPRRVRPR
jgi:hypothetical protein